MTEPIGGPRDHLANERTHLAWVRTSLSVLILGLAVGRFGDGGSVSASSVAAGAVLAIAAGAVLVYGSVRYRTTSRELASGRYDAVHSTTGPIAAAGVLIVAVVVAAVVLFVGGAGR